MSKQQWGHGYHSGLNKGVEYGESMGRFELGIELSTRMHFLLTSMAEALANDTDHIRLWTLYHAMCDLIKPHCPFEAEPKPKNLFRYYTAEELKERREKQLDAKESPNVTDTAD